MQKDLLPIGNWPPQINIRTKETKQGKEDRYLQ